MYKVKCTGKNTNYGDKDEIRLVADNYLSVGLKNGWFTLIRYEGSAKPDSKWKMSRQLRNLDRDIEILQLRKKHIAERLNRIKGGKI